jgi:hypothetical protein
LKRGDENPKLKGGENPQGLKTENNPSMERVTMEKPSRLKTMNRGPTTPDRQ